MSTVYKIELEVVSDFVTYNNMQMEDNIIIAIDNFKDEKSGLGLRVTNIKTEIIR